MTLPVDERKDCFIIVRVKKELKEKLFRLSVLKGVTLSILIRSIIKKYIKIGREHL